MKRYLSGIDWVIHSLDYIGKKQSGIGNISQVVIELSAPIDNLSLENALRDFLEKLPLINGFACRAINLCPYWKVLKNKKISPPALMVTFSADCTTPITYLAKPLNKPFAHKREYLFFNLFILGQRNFFGITFDHRILDARGAEIFLSAFQRYYQQKDIPEISLTQPAQLNCWKEKFISGRQVNRYLRNLSAKTPRTLNLLPKTRVCKFKTINFDIGQTNRFIDNAYNQAGYLMLMPYALAKSIIAMHRIFKAKNISGAVYIIPVSIDTRPQETTRQELFFNHLSFIFFKIDADLVNNFSCLLSVIKEQMYEQIKTGFPQALKNASMLLRIISLPLVNFFVRCMSKKQFAAFSFSFVNSAYSSTKFIEQEVKNIFHLPRVPNPPGIGIFFNQFNHQLNITLSYFDGIISEGQAEQIINELKSLGA